MYGKVFSGNVNCLSTSISTSFPEFYTAVPDAVYYLTFEVTENNVTTTSTASFNSNTSLIYTYSSIFSELMTASGYQDVSTPVDGWSNLKSVLNLDVFTNTLSGFDHNHFNWTNNPRPLDVLFIETPNNLLVGENGLQAIDLYPMLKAPNGNAPDMIHSCGYGNTGTTHIGN